MMRRLLVVGVVSLGLWIGCSDDDEPEDGTGGTGGSDTGGTGGGDTGGTGGGGTGGTGGGVGALLSNVESCTPPMAMLSPYPGENLQWAAARLTPASYPVEVAKIVVDLNHGATNGAGAQCDASLSTKAMVFKGTEVTPTASPASAQEVEVSIATPTSGDASYTFDLTSPVTLQTGEHLFVALQVREGGGKSTCIAGCAYTSGGEDRNYWAVETTAPFAWTKLSAWDIKMNIGLKAQATP